MSVEYGYVKWGEAGDLARLHPVLAAIEKGEDHYPAIAERLPNCPGLDGEFPFFHYLVDGGRVAASVFSIPDLLTGVGRKQPWAWAGSFLSSREDRGRGLGSRLWGEMVSTLHHRGWTVAGAFANPVTTHICRKLGFTVTKRVPRLLLLKSSRPFTSHRLGRGSAAWALDQPYKLLMGGVRLLHSVTGGRRRSISSLITAEELPTVLQGLTPVYREPLHFDDTFQKYAWKLGQAEGVDTYLMSAIKDGRPLARFALKDRVISHMFAGRYTGFRLMTLMDFVLFERDSNVYRELAAELITRFWGSEAVILETVNADPILNYILRKKLLLPVGRGVAYWYKPPEGTTLPRGAEEITNYHFTHFATDAYSFG
jgi:hypothetical protein